MKLDWQNNEASFEGMRFKVHSYGEYMTPLLWSANVYVGQQSYHINGDYSSAKQAQLACENFADMWKIR